MPNPHGDAFDGINGHIEAKKDIMDLVHLKNFEELIGVFPIARCEAGFKAYCAAFSLRAVDCEVVLQNATESQKATPLLAHSELYLIGVEFVG